MDRHPFQSRYFGPADAKEVASSWSLYEVCRYYFEFLRNIIIVGGLHYFAIESKSILLFILFVLSYGVFTLQIFALLRTWKFKLVSHFWKDERGLELDSHLNGAIAMLLAIGSLGIILFAVVQISSVQAR
jgi:hypothetical protein